MQEMEAGGMKTERMNHMKSEGTEGSEGMEEMKTEVMEGMPCM